MAGMLPAQTALPPAPYAVDEHTLHLWHLDEEAPPFRDAGKHPADLTGLLNGAEAGQAALPSFGRSVRFQHPPVEKPDGFLWPYGPILLAKAALVDGMADNVDAPFPIAGAEGAFTFEALVKLDVLPQHAPGLALDIMSMDDDSAENRVFIFRIEKPGFLALLPLSGNSVLGGGMATLPTEGPHAVTTAGWFHAAVAYNGREGETNNLSLYWTKVSGTRQEANRIGYGTLLADLNTKLGDFAVGNSGKSAGPYGPWEYFPGLIDEVRISGTERHPADFFFGPEPRDRALQQASDAEEPGDPALMLRQILVAGNPVNIPPPGQGLVLPTGRHRIDFDFAFLPGVKADPLSVRCRMEGLEDEWLPSARGMSMEWEMLDESGKVLARRVFTVAGTSKDWLTDLSRAPRWPRQEAIHLPEKTVRIRVSISSGPPDTTGAWIVEGISLSRSSDPATNLWSDPGLKLGERMSQIGGIPQDWQRIGNDPAMGRVMQFGEHRALGLLDARQDHGAGWVSTRDLVEAPGPGGETFVVGWSECYSVIPGASQRASYTNVPHGNYTFRAIALGNGDHPQACQLSLPVVIPPPAWERPWFIPLAVAAGAFSLGYLLFNFYRQKANRKLAALRLQHAVERDRARIARDMHDDLGTRVTVLNLNATLAMRAMEGDPAKAQQRLRLMEGSARDLVQAMHGLVWAVNPSNDSLDHLANHLSAAAQEIFRDSPSTLRISIQDDLPALPLAAELRHHLALAAKEALHNALKHAGPCEITFSLSMNDGDLVVGIADTGAGFDISRPHEGNGLGHLSSRLAEAGGTCSIHSTPGGGTRVLLRCRLPLPPAT